MMNPIPKIMLINWSQVAGPTVHAHFMHFMHTSSGWPQSTQRNTPMDYEPKRLRTKSTRTHETWILQQCQKCHACHAKNKGNGMSPSARLPRETKVIRCPQAPRLPRKTMVDAAKCHACHAILQQCQKCHACHAKNKGNWMSPSARLPRETKVIN